MLDGKTCIVVGGGVGIGEASAIRLGELGANVVVSDLGTDLSGDARDESPADRTVEAIRSAGGTAMAHFGDVTSLEDMSTLVDETVDEFGRVDGVVNFAGILRDSISYKMTEEDWERVLDVHLTGHFSLFRNVAAHWRERARSEGGSLEDQRSFLCVSSRSALGSVGQINYSAAKAGVLGLMRTGARELHRYNVRVNAMMPSAFTRMLESVPEDRRPYDREDMPPENVASFVAYMFSDHAEDITGCTFRAGGEGVGIVSDPEIRRIGYRDGGWSVEDLVDRFRDSVGKDIQLTNLERAGGEL